MNIYKKTALGILKSKKFWYFILALVILPFHEHFNVDPEHVVAVIGSLIIGQGLADFGKWKNEAMIGMSDGLIGKIRLVTVLPEKERASAERKIISAIDAYFKELS